MRFNLEQWLKKQTGVQDLDMPVIDPKTIKAGDEREWLVTNGMGSYASASISGANTRRYHGLFVASLNPPTSRTVLLSRIDEYVNGENISTNLWGPEVVAPRGFEKLCFFTMYPCPSWVYELDVGYLIKQVFMLAEKQEVNIVYAWQKKDGAKAESGSNESTAGEVKLDLHFLLNYRDFHSETHGDRSWRFAQQIEQNRVTISAYEGAQKFAIEFPQGNWYQDGAWYDSYYYPREHERGLGEREDTHHAGVLGLILKDGESVLLRASIDEALSGKGARPANESSDAATALKELIAHQRGLLKLAEEPKQLAVKRMVLAADQFVVWRKSIQSHSIIAGYHWFNDWGRDSMISLPGLTLATGRHDVAKSILRTFLGYLSEGMLPNNFPDSGEQPQYNTSDATFWWAWALKKYLAATGDLEFVKESIPGLESVVEHHIRGTRYSLRVDESDGLVSGGADRVQLTWMDAKVGDYVVTPRHGKAVEISALWYSFLRTLAQFKKAVKEDASRYEQMAEKCKSGFQIFWNADKGSLYDVISPDGYKDSSIRPNQLIALSLEKDLLSAEQQASILKVVEAELLTPLGLRSLSAKSREYAGKYGGGNEWANQWDRDVTYHQGTVWAWLLGPWIDARMNISGPTQENVASINAHLALLLHHHLAFEAGLGTISEIFDGDSPHKAAGCIAQAWSVAELLRVFYEYPELQGLTRRQLAMSG